MTRRLRRNQGLRGRVLDLHDCVRLGVKRRNEISIWISDETHQALIAKAQAIGITKSGLAALIVETVFADSIVDAVLDLDRENKVAVVQVSA